jgi:Fur family peroxide stress response transcriptional regulator
MVSAMHKRTTRQLAAVYETVQGDHSHPSADEIYRRVRRTLPRISLGTVYRNLQRLVAEGKIRLFLLGERVARYDPMVAEHDHFICQQCGRVEDLLLERDRRVNLAPLRDKGFTVTAHSLAIHGLCQKCGLKQREKTGVGQTRKGSGDGREQRKISHRKGGEVWAASRKEFESDSLDGLNRQR